MTKLLILYLSSPPTARCSPPCRNGSLCRYSNICECREGFSGNRCQFFSETLTSIHPIAVPPHSSLRAALTAVGTSRTSSGPDTSDLNPSSAQAHHFGAQSEHIQEEHGHVPTNRASSGSLGLFRADPDSNPRTNSEDTKSSSPETLELKSSPGRKGDPSLTGGKRRWEEKEGRTREEERRQEERRQVKLTPR